MKKLCAMFTGFLCLFLVGCMSLPTLPENADMTPDTSNNWVLKYYVDDYGTKTDSKYLETDFVGLFSNTATTNSYCDGLFRINDSGNTEVVIYEYGSYRANGFGVEDKYYITVWDNKTDTVLVKGTGYLSDDRFIFDSSVSQEIVNGLATHNELRVRVSGGKYTTSTYAFLIDASGFASKYIQLLPSES